MAGDEERAGAPDAGEPSASGADRLRGLKLEPIGARPPAKGLLLRKPWHSVAVLRILVLVGLVMIGSGTAAQHRAVYWVLVALYGLSVLGHAIWHLWRRRRMTDPGGGPFLFVLDAVLVTCVIAMRGEEAPQFLAAYFALAVMATLVRGLGSTLVSALVVSVVYGAVTQWGQPPSVLLTFPVYSQFLFLFVAALFMGHLAQEVRARRNEEATIKQALADSTEQLRAARESLHANERVATLGMMSAGIAHDLKNPLAAITSSLEPAAEILDELTDAVAQGEDASSYAVELREIFADCDLACKQLKRLALDLTSIARGGRTIPLAVDPTDSIEAAARILKSRIKPPLRLESETLTARTILADPGRLLQVLINLASNALDAMAGQEDGVLTLRAEDAGPLHIALTVEDNGPGISPEVQARIFEPFFTTKGPGKGTGLGLHLVSEITKSLSGTIHLESTEGVGSRFSIELPVYIRRTDVEKRNDNGEARPAHRGRRRDDSQGARAHVPAGAV